MTEIRIWGNDGRYWEGRRHSSKRNEFQCFFVHHKFYREWVGIQGEYVYNRERN